MHAWAWHSFFSLSAPLQRATLGFLPIVNINSKLCMYCIYCGFICMNIFTGTMVCQCSVLLDILKVPHFHDSHPKEICNCTVQLRFKSLTTPVVGSRQASLLAWFDCHINECECSLLFWSTQIPLVFCRQSSQMLPSIMASSVHSLIQI